MDSKVSIIMPTYKRRHTIGRAVASILKQSYINWELVIVDQGQGEYRFSDRRISYHKYSEVISAAFARNKGLSLATGDFVCFFDDDDVMYSNYLELMLNPFEDSKISITHCGVLLRDGDEDWTFSTPSAVVRRKDVKTTWVHTSLEHDHDFWKEVMKDFEDGSCYETKQILVQAFTSPKGGIRDGHL